MKDLMHAEIGRLEALVAPLDLGDRRAYGNWLAQTHYFVLHSTRLLALASSRFGHGHDDLHYRFAEHVRQEKGHDLMAKKDLKNLGFSLADFPELPETQAFYQTQYYWIEHVDPIAFFGYILCLEALAVTDWARGIHVRARDSFGSKASVFLKVHTVEDEGHLEQALAHLAPLDEAEKAIIAANLKLSCYLYGKIYERMIADRRAETADGASKQRELKIA
jgi:hypothetical protein